MRTRHNVSTSRIPGLGGVRNLVRACGRGRALTLRDANRAERNAIQRVVIRWLRPCAWPVPVTPTYRFRGLNE
jgi:hypothetical protein